MTWATQMVIAMILLQVGATVAYACQRQWNLVVYWAAAATINAAVLWRSM